MSFTTSFFRRPIEAPWSALNFLRLLGEGRYGTVWLCEDSRTGEQFACKKVLKETLKDSLLLQHFLRQEVALLDSFAGKHPNIIELKYVFEDSDAVYLMMEFCDAGDLFTHITNGAACADSSSSSSGVGSDCSGASRGDSGGSNPCDNICSGVWRANPSWGLPESKAVWIFRQIAQAVLFCHKNGVIHRDIKLENVLLCKPFSSGGSQYYCYSALPSPAASLPKPPSAPDMRVLAKLADFGLAVKLSKGEKTVGPAGSRLYEAPEVILGEEYDLKADVWSLGVLLFSLLSCSMPFQGQSDRQLMRKVAKGQLDFSRGMWVAVSDEAKDLIRAMLSVDPETRLSMDEVVSHPWLKSASRRARVVSVGLPLSLPALPSTLKSPEIMAMSPDPVKESKARTMAIDLPSLDPCRGDEDRENESIITPNQASGRLDFSANETLRHRQKGGHGSARDKESSLPPLPPTTPKAAVTDNSAGTSSPGTPSERPVNVSGDRQNKGRSILDSWFPSVSPGRGKWRMGF